MMMKKSFVQIIVAFILGTASALSVAKEIQDPIATLENATTEIITKVKANKSQAENGSDYVTDLIEKIIFPHVDFDYMSRWVIGRSMWNKASDNDRVEFKEVFKVLLLRTYANVVKEYVDEQIIYYPIRSDISDKKRIQVSSSITQANRDPIDVVYRMVLTPEGNWQLYDIVIEGVSLLKGFQAQFYDTLRQGGLRGLVKEIRILNHSEEASQAAAASVLPLKKEPAKNTVEKGVTDEQG